MTSDTSCLCFVVDVSRLYLVTKGYGCTHILFIDTQYVAIINTGDANRPWRWRI